MSTEFIQQGDFTLVRQYGTDSNGKPYDLLGISKYTGCDTTIRLPENLHSSTGTAFEGNTSIHSLIIPANFYASISGFKRCTFLESIRFEGECYSIIEEAAFSECRHLRTVDFPDVGGIYICENAFEYCEELTDLRFPASISSIGRNSFSACHNLRRLCFVDARTKIESDSFFCCTRLSEVYAPKEWLAQYGQYFNQSVKLLPLEYYSAQPLIQGINSQNYVQRGQSEPNEPPVAETKRQRNYKRGIIRGLVLCSIGAVIGTIANINFILLAIVLDIVFVLSLYFC